MKSGRLFTKSLREISFWNFLGMIILYGIFNFFAVYSLNYVLEKVLESKLEHEINHFLLFMEVQNDSLVLKSNNELKEDDLVNLTEHPFFLQIFSDKHGLYLQSENIKKFGIIPPKIVPVSDKIIYETMDINDKTLLIAYKTIPLPSGNIIYFQLSTFKSSYDYITKNLFLFNVLTLPAVILLMTVMSFVLAKKSLLPIKKIINTAKQISASNINKRIVYDAESFDELGLLRDTLNALFDRLERQIGKISEFTDNASHQLMSPLTAMKAELEYIQKERKTIYDYKDTLKILSAETDRMIKIVNTLLILAKDCEACVDRNSVFSIESIIKNLSQIYTDSRINYDIQPDIFIRGKSEYFLMAFQNIVDNALKYSKDKVNIRAIKREKTALLIVEDTGPGIPNEEKQQIFERFFRGKNSGKEGFGLGLSLTHSIITVMDGIITIEDNIPRGTIFKIEIPRVELEN